MKKFILALLTLSCSLTHADDDTEKEFCRPVFYCASGGGVLTTSRDTVGAIASTIGVRGHPGRLGWDIALDTLLGFEEDARLSPLMGLNGMGLVYATPCRCRSLYAGAGLGVGARFRNRHEFDGQGGMFAKAVIGYEWLRFDPIRVRLKEDGQCRYVKAEFPIRIFIQLSVYQPTIVGSSGVCDRSPAIVLQLGVGNNISTR